MKAICPAMEICCVCHSASMTVRSSLTSSGCPGGGGVGGDAGGGGGEDGGGQGVLCGSRGGAGGGSGGIGGDEIETKMKEEKEQLK